ncbi:Ubiquitin-activating enzyme E1 2, partial [Zea mays]
VHDCCICISSAWPPSREEGRRGDPRPPPRPLREPYPPLRSPPLGFSIYAYDETKRAEGAKDGGDAVVKKARGGGIGGGGRDGAEVGCGRRWEQQCEWGGGDRRGPAQQAARCVRKGDNAAALCLERAHLRP